VVVSSPPPGGFSDFVMVVVCAVGVLFCVIIFLHYSVHLILLIMVVAFTVDPRQSSAPKYSSLLRQYGVLAYHCTDLSGWKDDFRAYVVYMQSVTVDPFHPSIVGASGELGGDVVDDHLLGRDCKMSKKEWR